MERLIQLAPRISVSASRDNFFEEFIERQQYGSGVAAPAPSPAPCGIFL